MLKLFRDTIKVTNDNIILATPLIVFMWLLSLYLGFSKSSVTSVPLLILFFTTVLFMTGAFFSGWFYMVKEAINLSKQVFVLDEDKSKAVFNLLKIFPAGIGQYFLSFLGLIFISLVIMSFSGFISYHLGMALIGNLDLNVEQLKGILSSTVDMKTFLDSLTFEQLLKLNNWNMLILAFTSLISFLLMLWIPELVYKTKNPLIALFKSVVKIFKKPWKAVKLFIFMSVLNFVLSFISTFSILNPILYFIMLIIYFYFLVYLVVLIFSYYDREFE